MIKGHKIHLLCGRVIMDVFNISTDLKLRIVDWKNCKYFEKLKIEDCVEEEDQLWTGQCKE